MFTKVKINNLTTIESISNTDQAIIYNQSTQRTGKVSLSDLITAGGGLKTTDIIDVAHGGTGATSAQDARHNLRAAYSPLEVDIAFTNTSIGTSPFAIFGYAGSGSTYANNRMGLLIRDAGISLYDQTNAKTIWSINPQQTDSAWISCAATGTTSGVDVKKQNGICFIRGWGLTPGTTWTVLTTNGVPAGYRPIGGSAYLTGFHGSNGKLHMTALVNSGGQVQISAETAGTGNNGSFYGCYPVE